MYESITNGREKNQCGGAVTYSYRQIFHASFCLYSKPKCTVFTYWFVYLYLFLAQFFAVVIVNFMCNCVFPYCYRVKRACSQAISKPDDDGTKQQYILKVLLASKKKKRVHDLKNIYCASGRRFQFASLLSAIACDCCRIFFSRCNCLQSNIQLTGPPKTHFSIGKSPARRNREQIVQ